MRVGGARERRLRERRSEGTEERRRAEEGPGLAEGQRKEGGAGLGEMGEAATMPARAERRAGDGAGDERGVGASGGE